MKLRFVYKLTGAPSTYTRSQIRKLQARGLSQRCTVIAEDRFPDSIRTGVAVVRAGLTSDPDWELDAASFDWVELPLLIDDETEEEQAVAVSQDGNGSQQGDMIAALLKQNQELMAALTAKNATSKTPMALAPFGDKSEDLIEVWEKEVRKWEQVNNQDGIPGAELVSVLLAALKGTAETHVMDSVDLDGEDGISAILAALKEREKGTKNDIFWSLLQLFFTYRFAGVPRVSKAEKGAGGPGPRHQSEKDPSGFGEGRFDFREPGRRGAVQTSRCFLGLALVVHCRGFRDESTVDPHDSERRSPIRDCKDIPHKPFRRPKTGG